MVDGEYENASIILVRRIHDNNQNSRRAEASPPIPRSGYVRRSCNETHASVCIILLAQFALWAQEGHRITPTDIQRGGQVCLTNCARCHGPDGDAIAGVDLASNKFRRAKTDPELVDLIKNGIPGTPMPPGNYTDNQASMIVAYLHSIATAPRRGSGAVSGDPARGKTIFEGKGQCLTCHRVGEEGDSPAPISRHRRRTPCAGPRAIR